MVCEGGPILLRAWMAQVATLKKQLGIEVIWVTSGAIAFAVDRTEFLGKKADVARKTGAQRDRAADGDGSLQSRAQRHGPAWVLKFCSRRAI